MCGIFGIFSNNPVINPILMGLSKLEYRGYDSSGISVLDNSNSIITIRAKGKLENLNKKIRTNELFGNIGIGHTRWATHGVPSTNNAHPHVSENVSIVHNGIIENYSQLKKILKNKGFIFKSQTDSEVIAHLLSYELRLNTPRNAIKNTLQYLEGAFAIAILFKNFNLLAGARRGSPLALGLSDKTTYLGSDSLALAPFTQKIIFMDEGDSVVIEKDKFEIYNKDFKKVKRNITLSSFTGSNLDKGNFDHYMQKEIFEQPLIIGDSLSRFLDPIKKKINILDLKVNWKQISKIDFIACGTSYFACQTATYWFEKYLNLNTNSYLASEFRYKTYVKSKNTLSIFISQSGETADTLAALKFAKKNDSKIFSIVNNSESSIARESHNFITIEAGPEIGVASTKAFTAQLSVLACLCLIAGRERITINSSNEQKLTEKLLEIPSNMSSVFNLVGQVKKLSKQIVNAKSVLFLGRGHLFPIALEGALKLKEISYIHAEGYASGEMKHGPIALVDDKVPVIVLAPKDSLFEKNISNMQEILARGGKVILITDTKGDKEIDDKNLKRLVLKNFHEFVQPIIFSLPVQLLSYYVGVLKGTDVDQPRNLAKSVTVE